jgi:hypothetical protein
VRAELLRCLPTLLPELGAEHAADALQSLPVAVASDDTLRAGAPARVALWRALAQLAGQPCPGVTLHGVEAAVAVLMDGLRVDAGTCATLSRRLAAARDTTTTAPDADTDSPSGREAAEAAAEEWELALDAMAALGSVAATRLSAVEEPQQQRGDGHRAAVCCVARCGLVATRHLPTEAAVVVREWCLGISSSSFSSAAAAVLLAPLAAAVVAAAPPHATRVQWVLDTANAAAASGWPAHALALLSLLAAAWGPETQVRRRARVRG